MKERGKRTRFSTVPLRTQRSEPKSLGRVDVVDDVLTIVFNFDVVGVTGVGLLDDR
jgi:hypothetical protein